MGEKHHHKKRSSSSRKHRHHRDGEGRRSHHRGSLPTEPQAPPQEVAIEMMNVPTAPAAISPPVMNLDLGAMASVQSDPQRYNNRLTPELQPAQMGAISDIPISIQPNPRRQREPPQMTPRQYKDTEDMTWLDQLKQEIRELRSAGIYGKDVDMDEETANRAKKISKHILKRHDRGGLWKQSLKKIEGKFGSGVGAFFRLMRWVFLLNFFTGIVWFFLVLAPGFSVTHGPVDLTVATPTVSGAAEMDLKVPLDVNFVDLVLGDALSGTMLIQSSYPSAAVVDRRTVLLAGLLSSKVDDKRVYNFRIAFGATVTLVMGGISLFIIRWLRQRTLSGSIDVMVKEDPDYPYSAVLFGTWDHNVSNASAARIMRHGITRRLREMAESRRVKEKNKILTTGEKIFLVFRRIFGWILIVGLAAAFFLLITAFANKENTSGLTVPLIVATINVMIPFTVRQVVRLQGYGLEEIILTRQIMITYVLKMWNLSVLVMRMFNNDIKNMLNFGAVEAEVSTLASAEEECTILQVGREFWTLLFIDLAISAGYVMFIPRLLTKITKKPRTFTISSNVIDVIYRQALIWIGTLVSPAAVIVGIFTTFLLFYFKRHQLMRWCEPEYKAWGAAQGEKFFVVLLSITLVLCWVPTVWMLSKVHDCGPLKGASDPYITEFIEALDFVGIPKTNMTLKTVLFTASKPEYVIPICAILGVRLYFVSAHRKRLKTRLLQVEFDRDNARKEVVKAYARMRSDGRSGSNSPQKRRQSMFVTNSSLISASMTPQSDAVSKIAQHQVKKK